MKKVYTLLAALAATTAVSASETYELELYPVDYTGSTAVTTSTAVKSSVTIDGNSATFTNLLGSEVSPTFTFADNGATITCDIKGWQKSSYDLGTIGTATKFYFEKNCGTYTTATWNATSHTFSFLAYAYLEGEDDYDTYGFVTVMPDSFLDAAAAEQTLNCTGYFWSDYADDYIDSFDFTQTAKVKGGVVTLTNLLGSGMDVDFTVYDDGTAKQTSGYDGDIAGNYTFGTAKFDALTLDGGVWCDVEYIADSNWLWIGTYAYNGDEESYIGFYITLPEDFTPEEAPEIELWGEGNVSVQVNGFNGLVNGSLTSNGVLTLSNYLGSGKNFTFNITDTDGVKSVSTADAAGYTTIDVTIGGVHYVNLYTYGSDHLSYCTSIDGDYLAWYNYLIAEDGSTAAAYSIIFIPSTTSDSGVKSIAVDNSNAPVEFFNINGARINGDNLTPGLYIRRQGTTATKVLVR